MFNVATRRQSGPGGHLGLPPFSPVERLLVASFFVILIGVVIVGYRLERVVIVDTIRKTATTLALLLDDAIASEMLHVDPTGVLDEETLTSLDEKVRRMREHADIVGLKIWSSNGRMIYSDDPKLIGRSHGHIGADVEEAWDGAVTWRVSDLPGIEHESLRGDWERLLEIFSPIRVPPDQKIVAVAEFYHPLDILDSEIAANRRRTWFFMAALALPLYGMLAVAVRRTYRKIQTQEDELSARVSDLGSVLVVNQGLLRRVRIAAARATALNERLRQRISSELHDGPLQELGFVLLQLDRLAAKHEECFAGVGESCEFDDRVKNTRDAVSVGIEEIRRIAKGHAGVQVYDLTVPDVVRTAVEHHIRRTNMEVAVNLGNVADGAPLSVKITVYRFIQESLQNSFQHAGGSGGLVKVWAEGTIICAEVTDEGPGFDPATAMAKEGCLGLSAMRERVEILGGTLIIESQPGSGARLTARIPVDPVVVMDEG